MDHLPALDSINYTLAIVSIITAVVGWWRGWWESPKKREQRQRAEVAAEQNQAMYDAILGEPAVMDRAGGEIIPKRPGLVDRTATLEAAVSTLVNQDERLNAIEHRTEVLEHRADGTDKALGAVIGASFANGADDVLGRPKPLEVESEEVDEP